MKIGELANRSDCLVETIRYYERVGLLMPAERLSNNYRIYNEQHAERLLFIRHCRLLDITLDEIRVLLNFRDHPEQNYSGINELLDKHINHVVERVSVLSALEADLTELRGRCRTSDHAGGGEILIALD